MKKVLAFAMLVGCGDGLPDKDFGHECQIHDAGYSHTVMFCGGFESDNVEDVFIACDIRRPRDEQFEGEYVSYYENGNIERKGKYNKDGKRIGTWIGESWNEDSGIKYEKDYKNGLLMVSRHYEDDKLKRTIKYKYDKNGNKLEEYWNENNEIHCNKWIHDKNGKVIEFQEYVDGKLKESR